MFQVSGSSGAIAALIARQNDKQIDIERVITGLDLIWLILLMLVVIVLTGLLFDRFLKKNGYQHTIGAGLVLPTSLFPVLSIVGSYYLGVGDSRIAFLVFASIITWLVTMIYVISRMEVSDND